jgi:hypothetical protein
MEMLMSTQEKTFVDWGRKRRLAICCCNPRLALWARRGRFENAILEKHSRRPDKISLWRGKKAARVQRARYSEIEARFSLPRDGFREYTFS